MLNPQVRYKLNQSLDRWTAEEFKVASPNEVDLFYQTYSSELREFIKTAQTDWDRVAEDFFKTTSHLFQNYPWPKGEYIGYASMSNCNPRFLDTKTFQVYYRHVAGSNYVTAHELLHFIFYDYAITKFPDLFKNKNTESGIFWDIAEIFNSIVLHTTQYIAIHNNSQPVFYPGHKNLIEPLAKIWENSQSIDDFILEIYQKLNPTETPQFDILK